MRFTPSRGSRRKHSPLNLFSIAPQKLEDEVYARFKETAYRLMAKGLGMTGPYVTRCEDWWRSRFHDMLYPGHERPTHEQWLYNYTAETNWQLIWSRFKNEVLNETTYPASAHTDCTGAGSRSA